MPTLVCKMSTKKLVQMPTKTCSKYLLKIIVGVFIKSMHVLGIFVN